MGTQGTTGAISTILDGELDLDDLILIPVQSWCPTDAGMTLWAGGALSLPIDLKLSSIEARLKLGLPFIVGSGRTKQINTVSCWLL